MSFYSEITTEIDGKIASLKTISEKAKNKNNKAKTKINGLIESIMHIFKQLGGYDDMLKTIENILSNNLDHIEETIKDAIKVSIKEIISCGIEPSIGDELIVSGITFSIKNIDPMSILTINPMSENGSYAYFDNTSGIDSTDFNVFLYTVINKSISNNNYTGDNWNKLSNSKNGRVSTPLFKLSFVEYDSVSSLSNLITIEINESFRGEKLSYFISEYLDSVKLFNNVQIISQIFDEILGTKIFSLNKTTDQIASEKLISNLCDNIINNVEDVNTTIDNSYFTFSNDSYNQMIEEADKKRKGIFNYSNYGTGLTINQEIVTDSLNGLKQDDLIISEQTKILSSTIDAIANELNNKGKLSDSELFNFKTDIISKIINKLMNSITMFIFSPKIIYLFVMTSQLYGQENNNDSSTEFIKKNINLYKTIILSIRDIITEELIKYLKVLLTPLITKVTFELAKEKFSQYKQQLKTMF